MYEFHITDNFPYSVEETFYATARDFDTLLEYIPNLTKLETIKHEKLDEHRDRFVVRFHADAVLPSVAKALIKPEMLRWSETILTDSQQKRIDWEVITDYFTDHIHCKGVTTYVVLPEGSQIDLKGSFELAIDHVPGIPQFIVKKVVQILEPFIGKLIAPNMMEFYDAAKKRLQTQKK